MAITGTEILTEVYSTTDATSYTTASQTPTANRLQLLLVVSSVGTSGTTEPNAPTITGNSLNWVRIHGFWHTARYKLNLYRAMGSAPSAGTLAIDFAGQTQSGCGWHCMEFAGVDTTGTDGSGAIVQRTLDNTGGSTTSHSLTFDAPISNNNNATYAAIHLGATNQAITPTSGFTEMADVGAGTPAGRLEVEWLAGNTNTTVDWSWTTNSSGTAIAVEICVPRSSSKWYSYNQAVNRAGTY